MAKIILGLIGNPGSGKTALARYLADVHNFYHFEGSEGLRQLADEEDVDLATRTDYSDFHRRMQQERGKTILADLFLKHSEDELVFAGLRSTYNAHKLQAAGGKIIALQAPVDVRFARIDHTGLKYEETLETFKKSEEEQLVSSDGLGADLANTIELADYTLDTSKLFAETVQEIEAIIATLDTPSQQT